MRFQIIQLIFSFIVELLNHSRQLGMGAGQGEAMLYSQPTCREWEEDSSGISGPLAAQISLATASLPGKVAPTAKLAEGQTHP
jgi:hypothetical protein